MEILGDTELEQVIIYISNPFPRNKADGAIEGL